MTETKDFICNRCGQIFTDEDAKETVSCPRCGRSDAEEI